MECTPIYWAGKKKWWIWFQCYWLCSCDYPECGKWWSCKGNNLASLHARFFLEYWTNNFYYYQVHTNSLNRFCVHSERSWCTFFFKECWNKCLVNDDIVIYIVNLLVSTYMKKKRKKIPSPSEQFWGHLCFRMTRYWVMKQGGGFPYYTRVEHLIYRVRPTIWLALDLKSLLLDKQQTLNERCSIY